MNDPVLIGVDWGSSRLRCHAVGADGTVLSSLSEPKGILLGRADDLAAALLELLREWLARWPDVPLVASGMIGSRGGLIEAPYVSTPAGAGDLRGKLQTVVLGGRAIEVVPGLSHGTGVDVDVMRGEETILFGWAALANSGGTAIMPGTHSKWAVIDHGSVTRFRTFATGELYSALLASGSLKDLVPAQSSHHPESFQSGVERGLETGGLLHDYFALRAQVVTGHRAGNSVPSYLSGVLIGNEIEHALSSSLLASGDAATILSDGDLAGRYAEALAIAGVESHSVSAERCLARGWLDLVGEVGRPRDA